jgi:YbgC/YbaW family acyl-CoA thioester hydrolase
MFSITVELGDTWIDPVYQHVHHARCFSLMEQARIAFLEAVGVPNERLLAEGKVFVITKVEVEFKREVKGAAVSVACDRVEVDGRTVTFHQRIVNERQKTAVEGRIHLMCMGMETRRGIDVPSEVLEALAQRSSRR